MQAMAGNAGLWSLVSARTGKANMTIYGQGRDGEKKRVGMPVVFVDRMALFS